MKPILPQGVIPSVIITQPYLAICKNNHCAAALLYFFEYRYNLIVQAKANGLLPDLDSDSKKPSYLLQPCPMSLLEAAMLGLFKEKAIRTALTLLKELEFISAHKNPNATHLDNTLYILLHTRVVANALQ